MKPAKGTNHAISATPSTRIPLLVVDLEKEQVTPIVAV